jgi:hypothetical protein
MTFLEVLCLGTGGFFASMRAALAPSGLSESTAALPMADRAAARR